MGVWSAMGIHLARHESSRNVISLSFVALERLIGTVPDPPTGAEINYWWGKRRQLDALKR
jgi:hypothetical protein